VHQRGPALLAARRRPAVAALPRQLKGRQGRGRGMRGWGQGKGLLVQMLRLIGIATCHVVCVEAGTSLDGERIGNEGKGCGCWYHRCEGHRKSLQALNALTPTFLLTLNLCTTLI